MSLFSTFSNIGTGGLGSLAASTYLADDQDINQAELTYTEWETDLQMKIDRVESDRPGYDEYRYNLGAIEHDPYVLMGYLTSAYQGFTYDEVESVLRQLFQEQYTLSFSEETEIRYRTETSVDPEDVYKRQVFSMIQNLSETVVIPIAGMILTLSLIHILKKERSSMSPIKYGYSIRSISRKVCTLTPLPTSTPRKIF